MDPDQPVFGFDAAADGELTVVMLHRAPGGGWRVEYVDFPDRDDRSRVVARIGSPLPPPRRPALSRQSDDAGEKSLTELVKEWMAAHVDVTWKLTDEQKLLLEQTYGRLMAEGKLRLGH